MNAYVKAILVMVIGFLIFLGFLVNANAEVITSVATNSNLLTKDDVVQIEAFDDPKIGGVTCHVSRAIKGGLMGSVGLASDPSEASIACRQVGPIVIKSALPEQEDVFSAKMSVLFKTFHVTRIIDKTRNVAVYLTWSDKLIDGSPKNSISTVPLGIK